MCVAGYSMEKLFASLFPRRAALAWPESRGAETDVGAMLFSTPTLSNDVAELESLANGMSSDDILLHEDEWSQLEFLPASQFEHVRHILTEYVGFERLQRCGSGWNEAYIRQLSRVPVISGEAALAWLEGLFGSRVRRAPLLFADGCVQGRIRNGFSLPLGGNVALYGHMNDESIIMLGAHLGPMADSSVLASAFATLNANIGLILVDWRGQFVMVSKQEQAGALVWRPAEAPGA